MALYVISLHIIQTNSRTSTHHWKLNVEEGKVQAAAPAGGSASPSSPSHGLDVVADDPLFSILTNKVTMNGEWKLDGDQTCRENCIGEKITAEG